ncbi:hypothetical protein cce_4315 [Crocosphaera subtropica ATCC 51142]|uniref:Uncharacterized protein n=1 Tax=Crocosphaera subtropica (strain ATCC 51142 / BH68) TaxID=43989 RepID=B1WTE8_CROS5|nr:hypothetical protein cce_4315 [Crocosphaera subtropica ATCC 51142]
MLSTLTIILLIASTHNSCQSNNYYLSPNSEQLIKKKGENQKTFKQTFNIDRVVISTDETAIAQ